MNRFWLFASGVFFGWFVDELVKGNFNLALMMAAATCGVYVLNRRLP